MQSRHTLAICVAFFLVACDQGVTVGKQSALLETPNAIVDPLNSIEPLIIDDTEARAFVDVSTNNVIATAQATCSADLDVITPSAMSYSDGFAHDTVTTDNPIDSVRARNNVNRDDPHFIEVCVQTSTDRDYYIETLVRGPSEREDSFFFTVGDSKPVIYDVGRYSPDINGYVTDAVRSRDDDPLRVSLKAGQNFIRFHYRERNTALAQVKLIRLPTPPTDDEPDSDKFSSNVLACAKQTGLPASEVVDLIDQHLPTGEPAFTTSGIFNDTSLIYRYFITDDRRDLPRVFCLRDHGPVNTMDGLTETINEAFPSNAPSLILGSAATDILRSPMGNNVVFYGFAGNDSVKWQIGGEFFGGEDNDSVIGLTDGFFNGESGQDTVEVATPDANVSNANVVRADVQSPQAPTRLDIIGIDDYNVHVRWPENEVVMLEIVDAANGRSYFNNYKADKYSTALGPRFGEALQINGRTVLELDDGISLLSREITTVSFSKPELNELITAFGGELIRGPERFDRFTDATTSPTDVRWLTATPSLPFGNPAGDEPLIEMRLADQSVLRSISRDSIAQMLNAEFDTPCGVIAGESTHTVVAVTANSVEAFGFDASTLSLLWQHRLSNIDQYNRVCSDIFYSNGALYFDNGANLANWTETVRISDSGDIDRVPAPPLANDGFDQQPIRLQQLSTASDTLALSFFQAQNTLPEFPFYRRTIVAIQQLNGLGGASQTFALDELAPSIDRDNLDGFYGSVTDGVSAWLIARHAEYEHAVLRVNLSTGEVEAIKRYEAADELFSYDGPETNPIAINANVIEIGRQARIIRIDATTLERLDDVKVAGKVVAFDQNTVSTLVSDESGVSAYLFRR